jgi:hypothetical protein
LEAFSLLGLFSEDLSLPTDRLRHLLDLLIPLPELVLKV